LAYPRFDLARAHEKSRHQRIGRLFYVSQKSQKLQKFFLRFLRFLREIFIITNYFFSALSALSARNFYYHELFFSALSVISARHFYHHELFFLRFPRFLREIFDYSIKQ